MHLQLRAPNIWFRARLRYADARAAGGKVDVSGFTLPGMPLVVVGSNGHVAWGFTNSYGDWADWAELPLCAPGTSAAAKPSPSISACAMTTEFKEVIKVAGAGDVEFRVRETQWGPLLHESKHGYALALRWTPHLPGALRVSFCGSRHRKRPGCRLRRGRQIRHTRTELCRRRFRRQDRLAHHWRVPQARHRMQSNLSRKWNRHVSNCHCLALKLLEAPDALPGTRIRRHHHAWSTPNPTACGPPTTAPWTTRA